MKKPISLLLPLLAYASVGAFGALTTPSVETATSPLQKTNLPNPVLEKADSSDKQLPSDEENQLLDQKRKSAAAAMCLLGAKSPEKCETYKRLYDCAITCRKASAPNQSQLVDEVSEKDKTDSGDADEQRPVATPAASEPVAITKKDSQPIGVQLSKTSPTKRSTPSTPPSRSTADSDYDALKGVEMESDTTTADKAKAKDNTGDGGKSQNSQETKRADQEKPAQEAEQQRNPTADTSGSSSSGESAAYERCNSLYSSAVNACNVTDDTESASESSSLTDACHQSTQKGVKSSQSKTTAANACTSAFSHCQVKCEDYARLYSEGDYASSFSSRASSCGALAYKVDEIMSANQSSLDLAQSGLDCSKSSSESPQTAEQSEENARKARVAAEAASSICAAEPGSPGCMQAAQTAAALEAAGGLADATSSKGQALIPDEPGEHAFTGLFTDTPASAASKTATVPNNAGGSIPGGGGGSATIAGIEKQSLLGRIVSSIADIERGLYGGGYAAVLRGENPWDDSDPSKEDIDKALAVLRGGDIPPRPEEIDPDLRRYLPGGDKYFPRERNPAAVSQFHGPWVDIFQRVHDRYEVICRLGLLLGCEAGWPVKF